MQTIAPSITFPVFKSEGEPGKFPRSENVYDQALKPHNIAMWGVSRGVTFRKGIFMNHIRETTSLHGDHEINIDCREGPAHMKFNSWRSKSQSIEQHIQFVSLQWSVL